jgi:hydrogenase maturation factor
LLNLHFNGVNWRVDREDWVFIHIGFAIADVDERDAMRRLQEL